MSVDGGNVRQIPITPMYSKLWNVQMLRFELSNLLTQLIDDNQYRITLTISSNLNRLQV